MRIADLARNMIELSGFVPGQDIEIRYVGLRPGEKLFEELITEGENILPRRITKRSRFFKALRLLETPSRRGLNNFAC